MLTDAFKQAVIILETIESKGYEAYFVGGCVRDLVLERQVKDIDIASSAAPQIIQQIFDKVIPVGIDHGTVIVRHNGISYEVTTFRQEGTYSDQRHPDEVTFIRSIEEDLKRRDFTMNALAMDKHGKIIDLFDGTNDLEAKIIRSVGKAYDRFKEDPLRIIRALRFSSQLGFTIETDTLFYMRKLNKEVETVAVERLTNEFTKLFQGEFIQVGISYLLKTEIDKHIPIFKDNQHLLQNLPQPLTPFYSFAEVIALFYYLDNGVKIVDWVKGWKCSNDVRKEAINLYDALYDYEKSRVNEWLLYRLNKKYYRSFIHLIQLLFHDFKTKLEHLYELKDRLVIQTKNELAINGHDLQQMFPNAKKGAWMSTTIEKVEREVVLNRLENKKTVIKEWIRCHPPEIN